MGCENPTLYLTCHLNEVDNGCEPCLSPHSGRELSQLSDPALRPGYDKLRAVSCLVRGGSRQPFIE